MGLVDSGFLVGDFNLLVLLFLGFWCDADCLVGVCVVWVLVVFRLVWVVCELNLIRWVRCIWRFLASGLEVHLAGYFRFLWVGVI